MAVAVPTHRSMLTLFFGLPPTHDTHADAAGAVPHALGWCQRRLCYGLGLAGAPKHALRLRQQ